MYAAGVAVITRGQCCRTCWRSLSLSGRTTCVRQSRRWRRRADRLTWIGYPRVASSGQISTATGSSRRWRAMACGPSARSESTAPGPRCVSARRGIKRHSPWRSWPHYTSAGRSRGAPRAVVRATVIPAPALLTGRGSICWADLGEARGSKPARRRPVLVLQGGPFNASRLNTTIGSVITAAVGHYGPGPLSPATGRARVHWGGLAGCGAMTVS